jgi:hypothetical protein
MADGKSGKSRMVLLVGLLVVSLAGLGVRWLVTRQAGVTWEEAPPETRGVWTTSNARYAGRSIEVGPQSVTLQLGTAGALPGRLDIAREVFDDDRRILRLEYTTEQGPDALEMLVAGDGTMTLRNQPEIVWSVQGGPGFVPPTPVTIPTDAPSDLPILLIGGALALLALLGLGALVRAGALRFEAPAGAGSGSTPDVVRGVWTTPDPRFEGQSIRIAFDYGFAQFGPGDVRVGGEITDVRRWREEGNQVVALTYRTRNGDDQDLAMVIDRAGHMRLKDGPKSVWVKRA